ncbi:MAG: hypothetical protein WCD44_01315 [Candidatus Babeliales bacterium]
MNTIQKIVTIAGITTAFSFAHAAEQDNTYYIKKIDISYCRNIHNIPFYAGDNHQPISKNDPFCHDREALLPIAFIKFDEEDHPGKRRDVLQQVINNNKRTTNYRFQYNLSETEIIVTPSQESQLITDAITELANSQLNTDKDDLRCFLDALRQNEQNRQHKEEKSKTN